MSELRTEILVTNYARRKSDWSAFGHGFDTHRLHHETLDNTDCVVEGYLFLEVRTMNHIINKRDLLLKKIDSVNLTIDDKLVEER